jgi:hypothetical protein
MSTATMTAPPAANPFAGKATKPTGPYDLCPAGNHPAHLVAIVDLGTHDGDYQGKAKEDRKLFFAWELSGEMKPDGTPFLIGREYNVIVDDDGSFLFSEKSNVRLMMESWRGKKYQPGEVIDPMALLGRACLVNVGHKANGEKTYANLAGVSGLPKGMIVPAKHNELLAYHISMGEAPDLDWLPRSYGVELQDIIAESKERTGKPIGKKGKPADTAYSEAVRPAGPASTSATDDDSDLPF